MRIKEYDFFTRILKTRPLLLVSLLFLLGCIAAHTIKVSIAVSAAVFFVFASASLLSFPKYKKTAECLLLISVILLGMFRFTLSWNQTEPVENRTDAYLSGRICEVPLFNSETERTVCVLENVTIDSEKQTCRLRLYFRGNTEALQKVEIGQYVKCRAHIWPANKQTNPGEFDFSSYLRTLGINGYATADIEKAELSLPQVHLSDVPHLLRNAIGKRIDMLFPKNYALVRALLLGDRSLLTQEAKDCYSNSGAAHLLAISGMHISLLAWVLSILFGRILPKRAAFAATSAILLLYGILISFPASFLRAILMFALANGASLTGRPYDAPCGIGAALLVHLLIRPVDILSAGFILSYCAAAGIILLPAPLKQLTHTQRFFEASRGKKTLLSAAVKIRNLIIQSLIITSAAQIAIFPAVIFFFGAQPLLGFAVNIAAAPLAMAAYLLSVPALLLGFSPLLFLTETTFDLLNRVVAFFAKIPYSSLRCARLPIYITLLCAVCLFISSDLSIVNTRIRRYLPLIVIPAILFASLSSQISKSGCSIVFLDAGQADCAVIRCEGHVYLIDAGDDYSPLADFISANNYDIDGVILSHPHTDHTGGLKDLLEITVPDKIFVSPLWFSSEQDETIPQLMKECISSGSKLEILETGDVLQLSENCRITVVGPDTSVIAENVNASSLILFLEYGQASALFTGDALAKDIIGAADADVLKVPHHGSKGSLSKGLLEACTPSLSVVSVGYNTFGHPDDETLTLLELSGSKVFRTDKCGAITCRLHQDGTLNVETFLISEENNEQHSS